MIVRGTSGMWSTLPYGIKELDRRFVQNKAKGLVRCPIRSCIHWLTPPARERGSGEACSKHGIYVHKSGTYRYEYPSRNVIVDPGFFREQILGNGFKYESHRLGAERSEDTLSYNVFRSLQRLKLLHKVVHLCTGIATNQEPRLYLWGLEMRSKDVEPWDLLIAGRERFESDLPVNRPLTEPDIALFQPGEYLILIEAKFCSGNGVYERDQKTKLLDLTLGQLITIYRDPALKILDYEEALKRDRIHYQLWRNLIFAEWMAQKDGPSTQAYHVNLVRQGYEEDVCDPMLTLMRPQYRDRFNQISWEEIHGMANRHRPEADHLCSYLEQKTERFRPAFKISQGD